MEYVIVGGIVLLLFLFSSKNVPAMAPKPAPDTLGFRINNPGLLQVLKSGELWLGQTGVYTHPDTGHRFAIFKDLYHGVRAMCVNALDKFIDAQWNLDLLTFGQIWAPAQDNPGAFIGDYGEDLAKTLGVVANEHYNAQDQLNLARLAFAIVENENKSFGESIPSDTYMAAAKAALDHWGV